MEKKVLGHTFHPPTSSDRDAWAGASRDALICYTDGPTLFLEPDGTVGECYLDDECNAVERTWQVVHTCH